MTEKTKQEKIQEERAEDYKVFAIPEEEIPLYENPYQFTQKFQQCSIVKYMNISYSNNASSSDK